MKKIYILIMILLISILSSCDSIKEYTGTKITKLTYKTVDYMGGYTVIHELDFNENKYSSLGYLPIEVENPKLEIKSTFTDEEEKVFMDLCYTYGLFNIKESYKSSGIMDGGGWDLIIEYIDGTIKTSKGDNAGPYKVFNKCATVFYDLCGEGIVGRVPEYYITPPNISYSFLFNVDTTRVNTNDIAVVRRSNYKWNKSESLDNDYYQLTDEIKEKNEYYSSYSYKLILYTANYRCSEKFNKITVKEYDYNPELSNEKVIYTGKWFDQIELDIKLNKIYVYELSYKDGDYVQYTFSTYCNN